jgi:hypothetical protein
MTEKLSDFLEDMALMHEFTSGDVEYSRNYREAARIVRAVEEADENVFFERSRNGCAVLVALPSWYGKRVKLVEVK